MLLIGQLLCVIDLENKKNYNLKTGTSKLTGLLETKSKNVIKLHQIKLNA